ncbi:apolipoprotein L3-like [Notolabrus celidotus]|uniref:apolipoprotein L3-like n=1 Tax=Notolabrus celidotus TaxID=1203425 RepID=UPI00149067F2|nr:apolipoprotein L3-like [Notolabrus celidotus]
MSVQRLFRLFGGKSWIYLYRIEVWSLGCILYELCTQQPAFSAESTVKLISKIVNSSAPGLDNNYSAEFRDLLSDMLNKDPDSRPTSRDILGRPIILRSLLKKSKTTVAYLQAQLNKLTEVADSLKKVHTGTTIGSLTGGVIGAAGGITSLVGLILAPFTLGASLIVTGIGVGVGVVGGVTAGASNITNMVNQSSNRKAVKSIIKEFDEKVNAIAIWLQEIGHSLQTLSERSSSQIPSGQESFPGETETKVAARIGRSIGTAASEIVRNVRVANIGRIAAQASRTVRVAEVATGALSGLFLAFDIFFIAMDAKEIHKIRQTNEDGETSSEIMKFVHSVRKSAEELQGVLDEFQETILEVEFLEDETELEWDPLKA